MPSGAKKRKAAKKRKEIQPNNNANPPPAPTQGGGDVRPQDDRHSDVGEASSTASQEHSLHDFLTEGEEEKIVNMDDVSIFPRVEGVSSEGNNAPVEKESKIEDEFVKKNGDLEHDETERKSYDGGPSGSSGCNSSSCSDDESHGIKRSQIAVKNASVPVKADHSTEPVPAIRVSQMCKEEADDGLNLSYNPPIASLEADSGKDSGVTEPLLIPPPHPVEKASWKGCCGLFELFSGR